MQEKRKQLWKQSVVSMLSVILILTLTYTPVFASNQLNVYSKAYCVIDADSGKILMSKDPDTQMANASTTKILTCLYIIEHCDLNATLKVSKKAAAQPKVHLQMKEGEEYKVKDVLYALMLESYNDCAYALAEYACGSVEKFEEAVNKEATSLGAKNTHFVTPNGLDKKDSLGWHHTTASDLTLIMKKCIQNKTFLEITRKKTHKFKDVSKKRSFTCYNHNVLLSTMKGAISGKTGYTDRAGYCYVGAVKRNGITYIVSLLRAGVPPNREYRWKDMNKIISYTEKNYVKKDVTINEDDMEGAIVEDGQAESVKAYVKNQKITVVCKTSDEIEVKYNYKSGLKAPIQKDQKIGTISYYIGTQNIKTQDVYASKSVKKQTILWKIKHVFTSFFN